jgi:hypothetical protein
MTTKIFTIGEPPAESTGVDELVPNGHSPASLDQTVVNLRAAVDRALAALGGYTASQAPGANQIPVAKADKSIALPGRLTGGFGADASAGGVRDWNDPSNCVAGFGPVMLYSNEANGPNTSIAVYYHVLNIELGTKDGSGQLTQLAIPYANNVNPIYVRGRWSNTWNAWRQVLLTDIYGVAFVPSGVKFAATQVPSNDPNTLDDYRELTFTATATGMTLAQTGTVEVVKSGRQVVMQIPAAFVATSNATTFTLTGMPTPCRPSATRTVMVSVQDNSQSKHPAIMQIGADGVMTISNSLDAITAFTAAGQKGIWTMNISYLI